MPMELLRQLENSDLPVEVTNEADVDKLRVLCAAGLAVAFLPPTALLRDRSHQPAIVLAITRKGRQALEGKLVVA